MSSLAALRQILAPLFNAHPAEAVMLTMSVALTSIADAFIWVQFSTVNGASQTALNKRNVSEFWRNRGRMLLVMVKLALVSSLQDLCAGLLCLRWRTTATKALLAKYLPVPQSCTGQKCFPFYSMKLDSGAPANPDQRIADDLTEAISDSVDLARSLISNTVSFATWSRVLFRISPRAFGGLLLYAAFGTGVTVSGFSKALVRAQHRVRNREAHFRFALVRLNESAESVAFYDAAGVERGRLESVFSLLMRDSYRSLFWRTGQGAFQRLYSWVTLILPSMIMAPSYFRGEVELGAISQIFSAFNSVKQVLMFVANNFGSVASLQTKALRLQQLQDALGRANGCKEATRHDQGQDENTSNCTSPGCLNKQTNGTRCDSICLTEDTLVGVGSDNHALLRVRNVAILAPSGKRWLGSVAGRACGSSFDVHPGTAMLLRGPSGIGKSALLRAIAGLWNRGSGSIHRTSAVFFLPQVPYLPVGAEAAISSLREQLLFPAVVACGSKGIGVTPSAERLCDVLVTVGLGGLLSDTAGLETSVDWGLCLSGGERQRLAFARLLLQMDGRAGLEGEGCLVLLDEATSACDEETEANLYRTLLARLRRGALVSVGHRSSLQQFHNIALELAPTKGDGGWTSQQ